MDSTVIPALARWGLSADADLVYRALLMAGPADPPRLCRELGMARARILTALDELAAVGAASGARGRNWQPCPPEEVLRRIRRRPSVPLTARDRWRQHFATLDGLGPPPADLA